MARKSSIISVTENGQTQYCIVGSYGKLPSVAERLCNTSYYDRLNPKTTCGRQDWLEMQEVMRRTNNFISIIEIDADNNTVRAEENRDGVMVHTDISFDALLDIARETLIANSGSTPKFTREKSFYSAVDNFRLQESGAASGESNADYSPGDTEVLAVATQNLKCEVCGHAMIWENPHVPGLFHASSCYIEDWPICHECMVEHCCSVNCLGCDYGKHPDCRFLDMKRHYLTDEGEENV